MTIEIKPGITTTDIAHGGTVQQQMAVLFDADSNGILDEKEISVFNNSQIKCNDDNATITTPDGETRILPNISEHKSDEYYLSGTIPVAVIDIFSGTNDFHGYCVANIIKNENPDISVTRIDYQRESIKNPNFMTKMLLSFAKTEIGQDVIRNRFGGYLFETLSKAVTPNDKSEAINMADAVKSVKQQIDNGTNFKAVNFSSGLGCSIETINSLCKNEIGEDITPENISKHREQILEVLRKKAQDDENAELTDTHRGNSYKIKEILDVIDSIESLGIPVYTSQEYKTQSGEQAFDLLSLAKNTKVVGSGLIKPDGTVYSPNGSTNSFELDETGKRRIEPSVHYGGTHKYFGGVEYYSTSYASPMCIAKELKEQTTKEVR